MTAFGGTPGAGGRWLKVDGSAVGTCRYCRTFRRCSLFLKTDATQMLVCESCESERLIPQRAARMGLAEAEKVLDRQLYPWSP